MSEIIIKTGKALEQGWTLEQLAYLATVIAAPTAIVAIIVATLQYVASSRAQSRAHLHSIFRDYLAIRMQATDPTNRDDANVVGYRYYAMEEAYHWICKHEWWRPILYMSCDEKAAWLGTVDHHIGPDKNKAGHRYFYKNQNIFGEKFRAYCLGKFGDQPPPDAPGLTSPSNANTDTQIKKPAAPKVKRSENPAAGKVKA
jgi:hypothetical protein